MPAYRDKDRGTWFSKFYFNDWRGKKTQIKKRENKNIYTYEKV